MSNNSRWVNKLVNGKWRWCCPKCGRYTKALKEGLPPFCQWCGEKNKGDIKHDNGNGIAL